MRIAYLVGSYPEPSERFLAREIRALEELGAEITVYAVAREGGPACPWCVLGRYVWLSMLPKTWRAISKFPLGELATLRLNAWKEFVGGLDTAVRYARDMQARGIGRIHAHFATKPAAVGVMAAAALGLPLTISAHARDVFADGSALREKVAAAERVICCSRAALDDLASKVPDRLYERLTVIRHGLDLSNYAFRPAREPHAPARLLAAGRFVEKKGFGYLIDAMARLPGCVCEVAGSGPLEDDLRRRVDRLDLRERVTLCGWLSPEELRAKMADADVLVVPSVVARDGDRDGVPNVVLEAAAVGLPIVACNAGGLGEFVGNCETGRLVQPKDPDLIAGAVRSALATPGTTRQFAENARNKVENEYDLRENAKLLMDVLTSSAREAP